MKMVRWLKTVPLRVRALFRKRDVERELDEEMQFHVELQVEMLIGQGLSAADAHRVAMKSMGGVERQMEKCRDVRAWQWLAIFWSDVCYGSRRLMASRVFYTDGDSVAGIGDRREYGDVYADAGCALEAAAGAESWRVVSNGAKRSKLEEREDGRI